MHQVVTECPPVLVPATFPIEVRTVASQRIFEESLINETMSQ